MATTEERLDALSSNTAAAFVPNSSVIQPGKYKVHCKSEGTYKTAVLNVKGQLKQDGTPLICWEQRPSGDTGHWQNDNFRIESVPDTDKYTILCEATGTVMTLQGVPSGGDTHPIVMSKRRNGDDTQEWRFQNYAGGHEEPPTYRIISARNQWVATLEKGMLNNGTRIVGQVAFPDYKPMQGWWLDKQ